MHGATDPHGLPVIAMTLLTINKKDKCCAPIGTGKLYNNPLITTNGQILFNSVLHPFQDYFSSYETGQSGGGKKTGDSREKNTWHTHKTEVGLFHMLPARGSNPHQTQRTNTDLFNTSIYPRSSFSRTMRIDD